MNQFSRFKAGYYRSMGSHTKAKSVLAGGKHGCSTYSRVGKSHIDRSSVRFGFISGDSSCDSCSRHSYHSVCRIGNMVS